MQLWDVITGKSKATLPFDHSFAVAFSPDGRKVIAVGSDGEEGNFSDWVLQVWDASSLKPIRKLAGKCKESFQSPRLSRDGRVLAVHNGNVVELWDTTSGNQTGSIKSRGDDWAMAFALAGDGEDIVTLNLREKEKEGFEGHFSLWDGSSGTHLASCNVTSKEIEKRFGPNFLIAPGGELAAFQVGESEIALWRTKVLLKELAERNRKD